MDDFEKSRKNHLAEKVWMTDETISNGSWSYTENLQIKPAVEHLHVLIDIVSKNGCMLLNVGPKADGSFPEEAKLVGIPVDDDSLLIAVYLLPHSDIDALIAKGEWSAIEPR